MIVTKPYGGSVNVKVKLLLLLAEKPRARLPLTSMSLALTPVIALLNSTRTDVSALLTIPGGGVTLTIYGGEPVTVRLTTPEVPLRPTLSVATA